MFYSLGLGEFQCWAKRPHDQMHLPVTWPMYQAGNLSSPLLAATHRHLDQHQLQKLYCLASLVPNRLKWGPDLRFENCTIWHTPALIITSHSLVCLLVHLFVHSFICLFNGSFAVQFVSHLWIDSDKLKYLTFSERRRISDSCMLYTSYMHASHTARST